MPGELHKYILFVCVYKVNWYWIRQHIMIIEYFYSQKCPPIIYNIIILGLFSFYPLLNVSKYNKSTHIKGTPIHPFGTIWFTWINPPGNNFILSLIPNTKHVQLSSYNIPLNLDLAPRPFSFNS